MQDIVMEPGKPTIFQGVDGVLARGESPALHCPP